MRNRVRLPALICLSIALASCGSRSDGIDPVLTMEQRDQVQRNRPPLAPSDSNEVVTVQLDIDVPLKRFLAWFNDAGAPQFGLFMTGTPAIPGATASDNLVGSWREVGDRRLITFADGNSDRPCAPEHSSILANSDRQC